MHRLSLAMTFFAYNLTKKHRSLGCKTPDMAAGMTRHDVSADHIGLGLRKYAPDELIRFFSDVYVKKRNRSQCDTVLLLPPTSDALR